MLWLNIILIITSVGLIGAILLQNRSAGLGSAFGESLSGGNVRRGSEKTLFQVTIALAILFVAVSLAHLFL
jgi:preprotein translocase subunit SecG